MVSITAEKWKQTEITWVSKREVKVVINSYKLQEHKINWYKQKSLVLLLQ